MEGVSIKLHIETFRIFGKSRWLQPVSCQSVNKKSRVTFSMRRSGVRSPSAPPFNFLISNTYRWSVLTSQISKGPICGHVTRRSPSDALKRSMSAVGIRLSVEDEQRETISPDRSRNRSIYHLKGDLLESPLLRMTLDTLKHRDVTEVDGMLERLVCLVAGFALAISKSPQVDWMLNGESL
jgi:hypothetical protein